jgi:hypothetical protein
VDGASREQATRSAPLPHLNSTKEFCSQFKIDTPNSKATTPVEDDHVGGDNSVDNLGYLGAVLDWKVVRWLVVQERYP